VESASSWSWLSVLRWWYLSRRIVTSLCSDLPAEAFYFWYQVIYPSGLRETMGSLYMSDFLSSKRARTEDILPNEASYTRNYIRVLSNWVLNPDLCDNRFHFLFIHCNQFVPYLRRMRSLCTQPLCVVRWNWPALGTCRTVGVDETTNCYLVGTHACFRKEPNAIAKTQNILILIKFPLSHNFG
jgi:hypothetical protein